MKKIKTLLIFLLVVASFSACEKDDICVDGDTPLLVIRFYDFDNKEALKAVPSLFVKGVGQESAIETTANRTDLDSIGIPLNPVTDNVEFELTINSALNDMMEDTGNTDVVRFSYDTKEKFVSRACGFIATYENLGTTLTTDTENWIREIIIDIDLVDNQTTAHVKIFH